MKELYEEFSLAENGTLTQKAEVLSKLMSVEEYKKLIDYLYNRATTCFGTHRVYFVHLRVNGEEFLKVGYTKNTVEERFSEARYTEGIKVEIVEKIKVELFQAKGAVEFEKKLNELIPKTFRYTTELLFPGKKELISLEYKDEVLEIYNNTFPQYKDVIGLKSPN
jgi:hypothetical protein